MANVRAAIRTLLILGTPTPEICRTLGVTHSQIQAVTSGLHARRWHHHHNTRTEPNPEVLLERDRHLATKGCIP